MKRIHIFKTGTHTDMRGKEVTFGEADGTDCASVYDPKLHESPLVIGHPQHNLPAYGWVKGLEFADGELFAIPDQVNPEFAEMVASGAFKKISPSFYLPDAPNNPTPGHYYLRHVGFLGAQPPAVKGLKAIEFADDEDEGIVTLEFGDVEPRSIVRLFRGLRDLVIAQFGQEEADKALPGYELDWMAEQAAQPDPEPETPTAPAFSEVPEPSPASTPQKENKVTDEELKQREAEIAKREAAFAEKQVEGEAVDFADGLIKDGKLAPANKDKVVSLYAHLTVQGSKDEISFGEVPAASPVEMLKGILQAAPKVVDFSEHSAGNTGDEPADFADPSELATAARAMVAEQSAKGVTMSYSQAVRKIQKGA